MVVKNIKVPSNDVKGNLKDESKNNSKSVEVIFPKKEKLVTASFPMKPIAPPVKKRVPIINKKESQINKEIVENRVPCEYSNWSDWSKCLPCDENYFRERNTSYNS